MCPRRMNNCVLPVADGRFRLLPAGIFNLPVYLLLVALVSSCEETFTPKPRGYFRLHLPEKAYTEYHSSFCPFRFEYPTYATIERDTTFFNDPAENPCWMNIDFKELGGKIHISYKEINEQNSLAKLLEDSHKLTFKHTRKAQYIDETLLDNQHGATGVLYEIGGNAASNAQFFLTDSVKHYIRGSLYFSATPNEDSLAPVIGFVKDDMLRMIQSFRWEEDAGFGSQQQRITGH